MAEEQKKQIIQRLTKNLLDIQLLRIINRKPSWGYRIKKKTEEDLDIKLRHAILYPTLNQLEKQGYLTSTMQKAAGRERKIYEITKKGKDYLKTYYQVLNEQIEKIP